MAALGVILALAMAREDGAGAAAERAAAGDRGAARCGMDVIWAGVRQAMPAMRPRRGLRLLFQDESAMQRVRRGFLGRPGRMARRVRDRLGLRHGHAIVVWMALERRLHESPQTVEIAIISACVIASLFATFPWSRSFWTVFLYLTGVMGERPARAQENVDAAPPAALPPR